MRRNPDKDRASHAGDWIIGTTRRNPEACCLWRQARSC